ncbi:hypothetical protein K443DRAFT_171823 [Laccaria amethystina LaAM-08-1]|uniref:Uncharacterized protein n=1 Tax=Laccaria amethystina LaAM-08-1 TaxID=1095629 RepID=A0A0C9XUB8_9AGAR|nr:hypothetical protein K443DRAFT_171823 [Laccaria amethystina LaAM-08-1]
MPHFIRTRRRWESGIITSPPSRLIWYLPTPVISLVEETSRIENWKVYFLISVREHRVFVLAVPNKQH